MSKAWETIFGGIAEHMVERALECFRDVEAPGGTVLMEQGDEDPSLIYVLHGGVSIRKGDTEIDVSGPGELIGEMSLFRPSRRVARVVSVIDTRALLLDPDGYAELVRTHNPVAYRVERMALAQLGNRLRRLDGMVAENAEGEPDVYRPRAGLLGMLTKMFGGGGNKEVEPRSIDKAAALERSPLFHDERFTFVRALADQFGHQAWAKGSVLAEQGTDGDAVHVIAAGNAVVVVSLPDGKVHKMGQLGPGAAFGMTALLDGRPRMANVVATSDIDVLTLDRETFQSLVNEDSHMASSLRRAMIRAFAGQVEEAGANLVAVTTGDVPQYASAGASLEVYVE